MANSLKEVTQVLNENKRAFLKFEGNIDKRLKRLDKKNAEMC